MAQAETSDIHFISFKERYELFLPIELQPGKGKNFESLLPYLQTVNEVDVKILCLYYQVGFRNLNGELVTSHTERCRILTEFLKGNLSNYRKR